MSDTTLPPLYPQTPSTPQVPQMTPVSTPPMPTPPAEVFGDDIKSDAPAAKPPVAPPFVSTQPSTTPPPAKPAETHTSLDQALADLEKEAMKLAGNEGKKTKEVQPKIAESKPVEKPAEKMTEPAPMKQELSSLSKDLEKPFVVTPKTDTLPPLSPTSPVVKPMIQFAEKPAVKPAAPVTPGAGMETLKAHTSSTTSVFDTKPSVVEEKPVVTPPTVQPKEKEEKKEKGAKVDDKSGGGGGKKKKGFVKKIIAAAALAVLVIGLGVGIFVAQRSQDVRQQASTCSAWQAACPDGKVFTETSCEVQTLFNNTYGGNGKTVWQDQAKAQCGNPPPPSTESRCTTNSGSPGQACSNKTMCDITGGCNSDCGSGSRDGKICDVPNGYCKSGYSCRPVSNTVNVKKCDNNQCVNSWCNAADIGTDRCKTCSGNAECTNTSTGHDDRKDINCPDYTCTPKGGQCLVVNHCDTVGSNGVCVEPGAKYTTGSSINCQDEAKETCQYIQIDILPESVCNGTQTYDQAGGHQGTAFCQPPPDCVPTKTNGENPPEESPPPPNPPGAPMCQGIAKDITAPKAGDQVAFTCTQSTDATRYEFRYKVGAVAWQALDPLNATARTSKPLTVQDGAYSVQCRPCANNMCASWSTAN